MLNSNLHILKYSVLLLNIHMKTSKQIRIEKLHQLVLEYGTIEAVASAAGTAPQYLSQIRNKVPSASGTPRGIGDALARKLEACCGKPPGWMDVADTIPVRAAGSAPLDDFFGESKNYIKAYETAPEYVRDAADRLLELPEEKQREAARYLKFLAESS